MALKNIFKLTKRRQGELVGQIFKYISCFNEIYPPRSRVYLKDVAQLPDSVYWLENTKSGEVTSITLLEPKYKWTVSGIELQSMGHALSKIPSQIHNVLDHISGDYQGKNLIFFCRELLASAMQIEEKYGFVAFNSAELSELWSDLADIQTDYFNLASGETLSSGCARKNYKIYIKIDPVENHKLENINRDLYARFGGV